MAALRASGCEAKRSPRHIAAPTPAAAVSRASVLLVDAGLSASRASTARSCEHETQSTASCHSPVPEPGLRATCWPTDCWRKGAHR